MPKHISQLQDREWLENNYKIHGITELSNMLNCSKSGVCAALKRHKIEANRREDKRHSILKDKDQLQELYNKNTSWEIAAMLDICQPVVWRALHRLGISVNGHGKRLRKSKYKQKLDDSGDICKEHRYVMEKHLGRKLTSDEHIHHVDLNKLNNDVGNLIVLSNEEHGQLHGGKLKSVQVTEIRKRHAVGGIKQVTLAKEYGVHPSTISEIIARKRWKNVE